MRIVLLQVKSKEQAHLYICGNLAGSYLKAMAFKEGLFECGVEIYILEDDIAESEDNNIINDIIKRKPEVLGLSLYSWNLISSLYIAKKVKYAMPGIKIIAGGPEAVADNACLINARFIDIMVHGEGEVTFSAILKSFIRGIPRLDRIKGISYRERNELKINCPAEPIRRLDAIPSPYLLGYLKPNKGCMLLMVGRGCYNRCSYCSEWLFRKGRVSYFSTKRIASEISIALREGVKYVKLEIPMFNASSRKAAEICNIIKSINKDRRLKFIIEARADYLNRRIVRMLRQANIVTVEAGLETVNLTVMRRNNRNIDINKYAKGVHLLADAGISCRVNLMIGLPGETLRSFLEGVFFLIKHGLHRVAKINFNIVSVGNGTCLRKYADRNGITYQSKPPYRVISTNSMSNDELTRAINIGNFLIRHSLKY